MLIGHTNITGKACSAAMLLQRHSSHQDTESPLGVTIQLEHRQGPCLNCESVMDSNDFLP